MPESLKNRTLKGTFWSFADNIAGSGISFIVGIVLARLLTPSEFGIIGMVTIFIAISNSIVDSGFSSALIRKNDVKNIDYNTVFYFNLALSIVLYLVLFTISPSISRFFKEPLLVDILRILSLVLILNALGIIQRTILVKRIDFKTQTIVSVISSIASGFVGIGMALKGYGVWSLVGQQISRQGFNTLFLWVFNNWRPCFEFSYGSFKKLFFFGSKLLIAGLIDTLWKNLYYMVIGRFYSASTLGQYTRAQQFQSISSTNITSVVQRVSYPALSIIQDEAERLKQSYRKLIKTTVMVTFACMLGLIAISKPLVLVLIGNQWIPCISYLQILCLSSIMHPLTAINLNMLEVKGRSDLFLKLELIKKFIALLPLLLGIFISIEYMLWGGVITSIIAFLLNSYYSGFLVGYSTKDQIRDVIPFLFVSLIMATIVWSLTLLRLPNLLTLTIQLVVGIVVTIAIYEWKGVSEYVELKIVITSIIKEKRWKKII